MLEDTLDDLTLLDSLWAHTPIPQSDWVDPTPATASQDVHSRDGHTERRRPPPPVSWLSCPMSPADAPIQQLSFKAASQANVRAICGPPPTHKPRRMTKPGAEAKPPPPQHLLAIFCKMYRWQYPTDYVDRITPCTWVCVKGHRTWASKATLLIRLRKHPTKTCPQCHIDRQSTHGTVCLYRPEDMTISSVCRWRCGCGRSFDRSLMEDEIVCGECRRVTALFKPR